MPTRKATARVSSSQNGAEGSPRKPRKGQLGARGGQKTAGSPRGTKNKGEVGKKKSKKAGNSRIGAKGSGGGGKIKKGESAKGGKKAGGSFRGQSQSCHQCRQSIHSSKGVSEVKSGRERLKCSTCTRFWCEQCLLNRYGIVKATLDVATWSCPVCRKDCNCSLCRKREGKLATGILTPLVKVAGFGSVSDFLSEGTDDIARMLQWQSPQDSGSGGERRSEENGETLSSSKQSRKRRRSSHPLTPSHSPTLHSSPPHSAEGSVGCHENSVNCQGNGVSDHENGVDVKSGDDSDVMPHGNGTKKRRLHHSNYHIEMEGAELQGSEVNSEPKVVITGDDERDLEGVLMENSAVPPGEASPSGSTLTSISTPLSPPSLTLSSRSPSKTPSFDEGLNAFLWRSPRRRSAPERFTSENFRGKSKEKEHSRNPRQPGGKRQQGSMGGCVQGSVKYCGEERERKQEELGALRKSQLDSLRSIREGGKQLEQAERASERERKRQEREREAEVRRGEREREVEVRRLVRELTREESKNGREKERVRRLEELQSLKQERAERRRQLKDLSFVLSPSPSPPLPLFDDTHTSCNEQGIPPLPSLPPLSLPVATQLVSRLLCVAEFLTTFSEPLKLRSKPSANSLSERLMSQQGPVELYQKLLRLVVAPDNEMRSEFKGRGQPWEKLARRYLQQLDKNVGSGRGSCERAESRLSILECLMEEALAVPEVTAEMEVAVVTAEQARRDGRAREKQRVKSISDELRGLQSVTDIEGKRREIVEELAQIRRETRDSQYGCLLLLRNGCLGEDRLGRKYWRLKCAPGLLMEDVSLGDEDNGFHSNGESGCHGSSEARGWYHITSEEMLTQLMSCLHDRGRREGLLLSRLHNLQHTITASLLTP